MDARVLGSASWTMASCIADLFDFSCTLHIILRAQRRTGIIQGLHYAISR